jgi:uncharacterized protein YecE (DUF72 family)
MQKIRIGCSGYYYPFWKGKFYPKELKPSQWLEYYSSIFNSVELNGTFYRVPKVADLKKYFRITPDDFTFSVKASKYITHVLKLKDAAIHVNDFTTLMEENLEHKFQKLLFQLPPSFKFTEENMDRIIASIPPSEKNVIEFRDTSWWNADVKKRLQEHSLNFCNVDFPGLHVPFQDTTTDFYLRLHGNPELFKSSYSEKQLLDFRKQIPEDVSEINIYFNNTYYEAAFLNAQSMMRIFENEKHLFQINS